MQRLGLVLWMLGGNYYYLPNVLSNPNSDGGKPNEYIFMILMEKKNWNAPFPNSFHSKKESCLVAEKRIKCLITE